MKIIIVTWFRLVLFLLAALAVPLQAIASSGVVASIKPVAMLVRAVVGDAIPVQVLLPANVSPHEYALRFSDLRLLKTTDLVVWIGPELETMLTKAVEPLPLDRQLGLVQLEGMQWPVSHRGESGHTQSEDGHGHDHGYSDHDNHHKPHKGENIYRDPHLWLNPKNSVQAVMAITKKLSNIYPEHKDLFEVNAKQFVQRMVELDKSVGRALNPLKNKGFVVVHDGYRHFVDHYHLNQLAAIQLSSGARLGAKHYGEIMALGTRVSCVFTEPQLSSKAAIQLARKLSANHTQLDLMGEEIELNKESYFVFFKIFSESFTGCLANVAPARGAVYH